MTLNPMIADELSSLTNEVDELAEISPEVIIENFILYIVSHYSVAMELKAIG